MELEHDNAGAGPGWHLQEVIVWDTTTGKRYNFFCDRWACTQSYPWIGLCAPFLSPSHDLAEGCRRHNNDLQHCGLCLVRGPLLNRIGIPAVTAVSSPLPRQPRAKGLKPCFASAAGGSTARRTTA